MAIITCNNSKNNTTIITITVIITIIVVIRHIHVLKESGKISLTPIYIARKD